MDKNTFLQTMRGLVSSGQISTEEILDELRSIGFTDDVDNDLDLKDHNLKGLHISGTKILYILGGLIVLVGVGVFTAQIWDDIGAIGRILITFGLGLSFAISGSIFLKMQESRKVMIGNLFHVIGGSLVPFGLLVLMDEFNILGDGMVTFGFFLCAVFYGLLVYIHKSPVLTFFLIANFTAFSYYLLGYMLSNSSAHYSFIQDIFVYLTMAIGTCYLALSYSLKNTWNQKLSGALNFFGIIGLLGAGFSQVFDSSLWQVLYFFLLIGGVYLSIIMKSRSVLVFSAIFLIAHVSYITAEYFADSIGWPIALIFLGFVFIGLGYFSITINKKYLS